MTEITANPINECKRSIMAVNDAMTVTYELSKYGESIGPMVTILAEWGEEHRKTISYKA
ncbi:hypothetical protein [Pedobacter sp. L105]|uniref:hypothetical protein n=1 Tax=Pedobacter sp. L105 TaxID=1641871 RepID=UPI00131E5AF0|nr:hypothetical protein [Pedobacter sp. L105]